MKQLPPIRTENIVTQEIGDELMIYDLLVNKAFCLNETSMKVYNACGNHQSFENLQAKYNFSDDLINLALDELQKNDLLAAEFESPLNSVNRRDLIKKVGLASMIALPVISTLIAPSAAAAASAGCPPITACLGVGQDLCADCIGNIIITIYTIGQGCTTVIGSSPYTCTGPSFISNPSYNYTRN